MCSFAAFTFAERDTAIAEIKVDSSRVRIYGSTELNTPYAIARHYSFEVDGFQQYRMSNNLLRTFNSNYFLSGISDPSQLSIVADLGTIGSPGYSMIYQVNPNPGLDFGFHSYDHVKFHPNQTLFYNVRAPFTEIYYALGPKEEEILTVLHTQNINSNINAGFNYQVGGTGGNYARQLSKRLSFKGFTSIDSKNKRYHLNAQAIWNQLNNDQSGGITEDSLFEDGENITKLNIPVKLGTATSSENQQVYVLNQRFDFGKFTVIQLDDSLTKTEFDGTLRAYHSALFERGALYFSDLPLDTGYYPAIYIDSAKTDNHVHQLVLRNTIGLVSLDLNSVKRNKFNGGFAGIHEYIEYNRFDKDTFVSNSMVKGFISNSKYARLYWRVGGDYTMEGINMDDYRMELKVTYWNRKRTQSLDYCLAMQERAPSMVHYAYEGNHYRWKNQFQKHGATTISLKYTFKKHHAQVGVKTDILEKYIYYDYQALPQQDSNRINIYSIHLVKDFNWKHFVFKSRFQYQVIPDSSVLKIPEIVTSHSAYYHNFLFKKALYMQVGLDLLFNSSYYALSYAPSTQQFYLQSEKKVGNYPYLDFFVNFKINQAKIFIKASHINQGFTGNSYYAIPHYPRNDRALIVGLSWRFFD